MIENIMKDWQADPWATTTDTVTSIRIQTEHYGGDFSDVVAPSTANFPDSLGGTPTRYFLRLPFQIDVTDLAGAKPVLVYDNDASTTLTRVTGSPAANQYRVPVTASEANNIIELNSAQAGNSLGLDYYSQGGMFKADMYDFMKRNDVSIKSITTDYSISSDDGFNLFLVDPSAKMVTITLPALSENVGRVIEIRNTDHGITKVIRASSDLIDDGVNDATEIYLHSRGDSLKLIGSSKWILKNILDTIETGFINNSDWTNRHIGTVNIDIDGGSTGSLGFEIGEGVTSSNTGGKIIDITDNGDGTGTLIIYQATGGGNFTNNFSITGDNSSASATVNGNTKNVDFNFFHGSGLGLKKYEIKLCISQGGSDTDARYVDYATTTISNLGWSYNYADSDSLRIQTSANGVISISDAGNNDQIDAEDWYYNLEYERKL